MFAASGPWQQLQMFARTVFQLHVMFQSCHWSDLQSLQKGVADVWEALWPGKATAKEKPGASGDETGFDV